MYDFPIFPSTPLLSSWIYQGLLYAIIFFSFKKSCLYSIGRKQNRGILFSLLLLVVLYFITAFADGDFIHYQAMVKSYRGPESTGLESVYEYVIALTNQNYLLFRTIFWGGIVLIFPRLFKNYYLDPNNSLYFLFAVYIGTLSYSRASFGMTFFFLGLSLFYAEEKKLRNIVIGLLLVVSSYFFHRSCVVLIPMAFMGLVPINKKTVPIILGAVLFSFAMLRSFASDIIEMVEASDYEDLSNKVQIYASESSGQFTGGAFAWFMHIWSYGVFYVLFFVDAYYILYKNNHVSVIIQRLFNVSFGILLFSVLVFFFNMTNAAIYYRYLFMLMIPTTIITTYLFQKGIMSFKLFRFLFWFGCIPTIERMAYYIYYLSTH